MDRRAVLVDLDAPGHVVVRVAQVEQVAVVALVTGRERHRVAHSRLEAPVLVDVGNGVLFLVGFFLASVLLLVALAGVLFLAVSSSESSLSSGSIFRLVPLAESLLLAAFAESSSSSPPSPNLLLIAAFAGLLLVLSGIFSKSSLSSGSMCPHLVQLGRPSDSSPPSPASSSSPPSPVLLLIAAFAGSSSSSSAVSSSES